MKILPIVEHCIVSGRFGDNMPDTTIAVVNDDIGVSARRPPRRFDGFVLRAKSAIRFFCACTRAPNRPPFGRRDDMQARRTSRVG